MALLLHLSDLHLAAANTADVVADMKEDVLRLGDQQTRLGILEASLAALGEWLRDNKKRLDTLVISGDISVANDLGGFQLLKRVLERLGASLPEPDRILIVPGNHDVARFSPPGSLERYEHFLTLRSDGYRTADLEGIDISGAPPSRRAGKSAPAVVAVDKSFMVVGLNSSNHSQSGRPVPDDLQAVLPDLEKAAETDLGIDALLKSWKSRSVADIARVDSDQRTLAHALFVDEWASTPHDGSLRIVTLHHQVQPVGPNEEVKAYDTLMNLGEFRDWLATNKIDVVLHGHKHAGWIGADSHAPYGTPSSRRHEMLLVSAPSLQAQSTVRDPIGYLIDVPPGSPRSAGIEVAPVRSVSPGDSMQDLEWTHHTITSNPTLGIIEGDTIEKVHRDLLALRNQYEQLRWPLVCSVEDGASALVAPETLQLPQGVDNRDHWFADMVDWWQDPRTPEDRPFTHGQRLYRYGAVPQDQVARIITTLRSSPTSSRAVAVLLDPTADLGPVRRKFPAFVLVQFLVRQNRLDVVAHFRKQEMPHWWPINVGELAQLQRTVVAGIRTAIDVTPGRITTVTAKPVAGDGYPSVAIPLIDRIHNNPTDMLALVLPLFALADAASAIERWTRVFTDWRPTPAIPADEDVLPKIGLTSLADLIDSLAPMRTDSNDSEALRVASKLRSLDSTTSSWAGQPEAKRTADARASWLARIDRDIAEILTSVSNALAAHHAPHPIAAEEE